MNTRNLIGIALLALTPGCVYTNIMNPLDTNLDQTKLGDKVGEASFQSVMWVAAWGDAGTQAAAEQGGITTIRHADRKIYSILFGLYYKQTTVVYGD